MRDAVHVQTNTNEHAHTHLSLSSFSSALFCFSQSTSRGCERTPAAATLFSPPNDDSRRRGRGRCLPRTRGAPTLLRRFKFMTLRPRPFSPPPHPQLRLPRFFLFMFIFPSSALSHHGRRRRVCVCTCPPFVFLCFRQAAPSTPPLLLHVPSHGARASVSFLLCACVLHSASAWAIALM